MSSWPTGWLAHWLVLCPLSSLSQSVRVELVETLLLPTQEPFDRLRANGKNLWDTTLARKGAFAE